MLILNNNLKYGITLKYRAGIKIIQTAFLLCLREISLRWMFSALMPSFSSWNSAISSDFPFCRKSGGHDLPRSLLPDESTFKCLPEDASFLLDLSRPRFFHFLGKLGDNGLRCLLLLTRSLPLPSADPPPSFSVIQGITNVSEKLSSVWLFWSPSKVSSSFSLVWWHFCEESGDPDSILRYFMETRCSS